MSIEYWSQERFAEEDYWERVYAPSAEAVEAEAEKAKYEQHWHAVHDEDGLSELLNEVFSSHGGTEDLARYISALMRAPKECQSIAAEELRQTLLKWAARIA